MSIKFPDLQVLLPRTEDASRLQQQQQRGGELMQAQAESVAAAETLQRRRQVSKVQEKDTIRVGQENEKEKRQQHSHEERQSEQNHLPGASRPPVSGLGQKIDIKI